LPQFLLQKGFLRGESSFFFLVNSPDDCHWQSTIFFTSLEIKSGDWTPGFWVERARVWAGPGRLDGKLASPGDSKKGLLLFFSKSHTIIHISLKKK